MLLVIVYRGATLFDVPDMVEFCPPPLYSSSPQYWYMYLLGSRTLYHRLQRFCVDADLQRIQCQKSEQRYRKVNTQPLFLLILITLEWNVFDNILGNYMFIGVLALTMLLQVGSGKTDRTTHHISFQYMFTRFCW